MVPVPIPRGGSYTTVGNPQDSPQFGNTGTSEHQPRIGQRVQPIRRESRAANTTNLTNEMAGHRGYGDSKACQCPFRGRAAYSTAANPQRADGLVTLARDRSEEVDPRNEKQLATHHTDVTSIHPQLHAPYTL